MPFIDSRLTTNYKKAVKDYIRPIDTAISIHLTVEEALEELRARQIRHQTQYIYAIHENGQLEGVLSTRSLLFANKNEKIANLLSSQVIAAYEDEKVESVLRVLVQHHLLALPIIDTSRRLIGIFEIIPYSQSQELAFSPSNSHDIFQLIGLSLEQNKFESPIASFKHRLPWLFCNIFAGLICAFIASFFHLVLDIFVALSLFIPLVLTLSESVSMQSTTLSLQFLHIKEIPWKRIIKQVRTELQSVLTCLIKRMLAWLILRSCC